MVTVSVSSRFQIVIPLSVRKELRIRPGDKPAVVVKHGVVHLVPVRPFGTSRGMFERMPSTHRDIRDHDERF